MIGENGSFASSVGVYLYISTLDINEYRILINCI